MKFPSEQLCALTSAFDEDEIARAAVEVLGLWSEAAYAAIYQLNEKEERGRVAWWPCAPDGELSSILLGLTGQAFEKNYFGIDGVGVARTKPVVYEGRHLATLITCSFSGSKQGGICPVLEAVSALLGEKLGHLRLLDDFTQVDSLRQQELRLDLELERVLDELVDGLSLEFASIWLADVERRDLRVVRARNLPVGRVWSNYSLDSRSNIIVDVFHNRTLQRVNGRLEGDHFERRVDTSHPDGLSCVLVPLWWNDDVIGVIEAGGSVLREPMADAKVDSLVAIARSGHDIGSLRPASSALDVLLDQLRSSIQAKGVALEVLHSSERIINARAGSLPMDQSKTSLVKSPGSNASDEWRWGSDGRNGDEGAWAALAFRPDAEAEAILTAVWDRHPGDVLHRARFYLRRLKTLVSGELAVSVVRDSLERSHHLTSLQSIAFTSFAQEGTPAVLREIAERASVLLGADQVCIYEYFGGALNFGRLATICGDFREGDLVVYDAFPMDIVQSQLKEKTLSFIQNVQQMDDMLSVRKDGKTRFVAREGIQSCSILKLVDADRQMIGMMFLNYRKSLTFSRAYRREAEALAAAAGTALTLQRFRDLSLRRSQRSEAELDALRKLDLFTFQQMDLPELKRDIRPICEYAIELLMTLTECDIGCVVWYNSSNRTLEFIAFRGFTPPEGPQDASKGIVPRAFRKERAELISDTQLEEEYVAYVSGMRSELAVPLSQQSGVIGAVNLEDHRLGHFTNDDVRLVQLFAGRLAFATRMFSLYSELKGQIGPRITHGVIATRIQNAKQSLPAKLRLLLTGVTAEEGLGFSRAMLFVLDEGDKNLRGVLAIGSLTEAEAHAVWDVIHFREPQPFEDRLVWILERADQQTRAVERGKPDTEINQVVQQMAWRTEVVQGLLADCLQTGVARTLGPSDAQTDWLGQAFAVATGAPSVSYALWGVPLIATGTTLGVLVVDNRFQDEKQTREQPAEKLRTLGAFAELAAMSIENWRLRERVRAETYEKLNHEIKNPITIARQFLSQAADAGQSLNLIQAADAQMQRAFWVASNAKLFADFSLGRPLSGIVTLPTALEIWERLDALTRTWQLLSPKRKLRLDAPRPEGLPQPVYCNPRLVEQALYAIFQNAVDYTIDDELIEVFFRLEPKNLRIIIRNPAPPMSAEEMSKIRELYGRGNRGEKMRGDGSGIGLNIATAAVQAQGGDLQTTCHDGIFETNIVLSLPTSRL